MNYLQKFVQPLFQLFYAKIYLSKDYKHHEKFKKHSLLIQRIEAESIILGLICYDKVIKEKFGTENVKIERAHRIGKEERDEPSQKKTIIAKFLNFKDKEKVL